MRTKRLGSSSIVVTAVLLTGASLSSVAQAAPRTAYSPVEVLATPNAQCTLTGTGMAKPIYLWANELGVVRFSAIQAGSNDPAQNLSLRCVDEKGNGTTSSLDLKSTATFKRLSNVPIPASVHVRPALVGDPMRYSWDELLKGGYGNRPDPAKRPLAYAKWLRQATREMTEAPTVHQELNTNGGSGGNLPVPTLPAANTSFNNNIWSGGVLNSGGYTYADGSQTIYGLEATTSGCTSASLWVGIGGYGHSDLIQTGVEEFSQGSAEYLNTWYEYVSGASNTLVSLFNVSDNDDVYMQVWECNASGSEVTNGGYGCFYISDSTNGQYAACDLATETSGWSSNAFDCTGPNPPCTSSRYCHSIKASPHGRQIQADPF